MSRTRLDLIENSELYVLVTNVKSLLEKVTVTSRKEFYEEYSFDKDFENFEDGNNYNFQRELNQKKVKEIARFVENSLKSRAAEEYSPVIFPTPIILGYMEDNENILSLERNIDLSDFENASLFIVDGQHRLFGIKKALAELEESNIDLYRNLCDLEIVSFVYVKDLQSYARMFAEVNFKVTKVNKSMYYEIFGNFFNEIEFSDLQFCTTIINFLNNKNENLQGNIARLKTETDKISQSLLVEGLIKIVSKYRNMPGPLYYFYNDRVINGKDSKGLKVVGQFINNFFDLFFTIYNFNEIKHKGHVVSALLNVLYDSVCIKTILLGRRIDNENSLESLLEDFINIFHNDYLLRENDFNTIASNSSTSRGYYFRIMYDVLNYYSRELSIQGIDELTNNIDINRLNEYKLSKEEKRYFRNVLKDIHKSYKLLL
ncbi:DGQHR domain-containing protein [Halobacteriovorax sp. CON-3]|uniref:DGQHR domain-containing protein n=1 Tax=Halobacteriovorax sp. CON-3 TaxID=3157710 RepID=UPI0037108EF9